MKLFAIFGNPVEHSRSPLMHNHVFNSLHVDAKYTRVHLKDGSKLKETFFSLKLSGANVTVPHKESAFKACDEVRGFAKKIGVVNTLINEDGRLIGYNTDADGFMYAISEFENIENILIIGAGGTAKALANRFLDDGLHVNILNRSKDRLKYFEKLSLTCKSWDDMLIEPYDLIVNTTSAGLKDENYPAPLEILKPLLEKTRYSADAIYGKLTPFLRLAHELNLTCKDGTDMLIGQGVLAKELFTQHTLDKKKIEFFMRESFSF